MASRHRRQGNSGVAAAIKQTAGAIGYVEQAYALQNGFTYASVKNSSGKFIAPTLAAASAAADGIKVPPDLTISTINSPNPAAYPITSQTFVIVYKDMCKAGHQPGCRIRRQEVPGLRARLAGQGVEKQLFYAPLPASLLSKAQAQLKTLTCNGSPLQ